MKCTFCGSRIDATDGFCSNCGSKVKGMAIPSLGGGNTDAVSHGDSAGQSTGSVHTGYGSGNPSGYGSRNMNRQPYSNNPTGYGNVNANRQSNSGNPIEYGSRNTNGQQYGGNAGNGSVNSGYQNNSFSMGQNIGTMPYKTKATSKGSVIAIIFIFVLIIIGSLYFTVFRDIHTKTFTGNGYSIEMPASMKKTDKTYSTVIDSYANTKMSFVVEKLEYSDLAMLGYGAGMTSQNMFDLLSLYSTSNVTFTSCDGSYLYFTQNVSSTHMSGVCRMIEGDGGYYFFEFGCEASDKSRYHDDFKEWLTTAKLT